MLNLKTNLSKVAKPYLKAGGWGFSLMELFIWWQRFSVLLFMGPRWELVPGDGRLNDSGTTPDTS